MGHWHFRNKALHSPTGPTLIASHHSLNYRISKQKRQMVSTAQITIYFLNSTQSPNYNPVASPTRSSGCTRWVWHVRNTLNLTMQSHVRPSPCVTRCNPSWSPTAYSSPLSHGIDPLLSRTIISPMKNNMQLLSSSLDHRQSMHESHPVWLLSTTSYNKLLQ